MGNYESLAVLIFIALVVYIFDRKNFRREGIVFLRRTQRGLDIIDSIAKKHPGMIAFLADAGIVFSFGLMGLRYLFIEKKTYSFKRIRHYATYILLSSLFIYSIYNIFFIGLIDAFNIPLIYSGTVLFLLVAFTFLFGVSGYGFMTLFFGAVGILLSSFTGAVVESSIKLVLPVEVSQDSDLPIFSVPIAEWLISILFILVVHEFSHAIVARKEGIKVKSLGYGFLGPLPLGFAEPDEKEIKASSSITKTRIFGAGSFSNILAASLIFLLYLVTMALGLFSGSVPFVDQGVYILAVNSTMPAGILPVGGIITMVDGINTTNVSEFVAVMETKGPNDNLTMIVDGKEYRLTLLEDPENKTMGKMGIIVTQNRTLGPIGFFASLVNWLVLLNIGIALANLFPLRPLDGGLMLEEVLIGAGIRNRKETAQTISKMTLALLLISLLMPWLISMFS